MLGSPQSPPSHQTLEQACAAQAGNRYFEKAVKFHVHCVCRENPVVALGIKGKSTEEKRVLLALPRKITCLGKEELN